jgi:exodeoxyribonuclease-5
MIELLLRHHAYVIFLGVPFQLPPINKDSDNHLLDNPHIFLDEIMRQALDSEIIQLTLAIREGKNINHYQGKEVQVLNHNELNTGMLTWADQIICGTNKTRVDINNQMRSLQGHDSLPEDWDKVICLRNYWDYFADNGDYLVNGTIGYVNNSYKTFNMIPPFFGGGKIDVFTAQFVSDTSADYGVLNMDMKQILTGERALDSKTIYRLMRSKKYSSLVPMEFTYAYAITCHKAQGSQWNNVLVIEEKFPFAKEEHARWLYTACTRAIDKLVIVR